MERRQRRLLGERGWKTRPRQGLEEGRKGRQKGGFWRAKMKPKWEAFSLILYWFSYYFVNINVFDF